MKAVLATPDGAVLQETARPTPASGQILVEVHVAALNRADLRTLQLGKNDIIGMEWAGTVVEIGPDTTDFKIGDRVMCSGSRAFGEYAVADEGRAALIPDELSFREAASSMLALQTMHNAVVTHGKVKRGDTVLIHGAASGVGLMAAQIARLQGAAQVIGTSRDAGRREAMRGLGFDLVLDSTSADWTSAVLKHTQDRGVDVVIDQVAGPMFNDLLKVTGILGRIVNVGRLGGASGPFDFETHALKRITYTGVTFRTRTPDEIKTLTRAMISDLGAALARNELKMPLDQEFPLEEAAQAFSRLAANQHFGKITVRVREE